MALLTPDTVIRMMDELHSYKIDREAAATVAHIAGAMMTLSAALTTLKLTGAQPPIDYAIIQAEAQNLRRR